MSDAPPALWQHENAPLYNDASIGYNDPIFYNSVTLDAPPALWFQEQEDLPE